MTAIAQTATDVMPPLPVGSLLVTPARRSHVVDVSRRATPWRWTSVLLAPIELLTVVWSIPIIILLLMVPIALAVTAALWVARRILSL